MEHSVIDSILKINFGSKQTVKKGFQEATLIQDVDAKYLISKCFEYNGG
jgi:hypothetical protein